MRIPVSTLHQIISGKVKNPKIEYLIKIADRFNLTVDELVGHNQENLTVKEKKVKEAIYYLRYVATNWLARERIEDLPDEEIIKIADYIKDVEAREKAEEGD